MRIRVLDLVGPAGHDQLRGLVRDVLDAPFGDALTTFAEEALDLVEEGDADVVLALCPAPGDDLDAWESRVGGDLDPRHAGAELTLLYSGGSGWAGGNTATKDAARRLSPHPIRLLWGAESDRSSVEGDLLGAVLALRAPRREALLARLREGSADLLAWPRTLPDGTFVERPERDRLMQGVGDHTTTTRLLVGGPGSGKSALLADVGVEMVEAGVPVVAVKADALPVDIENDAGLGVALGVPFGLTTVVRALRLGGAVVVLIDQLDAVSALLDVRTERLDALLGFLGAVAGLTGVHVLASTRPFERMYDARLRSIEADEIDLGRMDVDATADALRANGLAHLAASAGEIDTPWALDVVVRTRPEAGGSLSLMGVLGRYWDAVVDSGADGARRQVAERLAADIANQEAFWVDEEGLITRSGGSAEAFDALVQEGVLIRFAGRLGTIGFRHQTLYAYALARAFAGGGESIADHVIEARREGLFVRPTLLATLEMLRESDSARYRHELGRLLRAPTRLHLRMLLLQWLGRQTEPTAWERERIREILGTEEGDRMLIALASSPGSVGWLAEDPVFHDWFRRASEEAEPLLPLLRVSATDHADTVRSLLQAHWQGAAFDDVVDEVLSAFPTLLGEDIDRICVSARRGTPFRSLHRIVERAGPIGAARVLRASLDRRLAEVEQAEADERAAAPGPLRTRWDDLRGQFSVRWEQVTTLLKERRWPSAESVRVGRIDWSGFYTGGSRPTYEGLFGRLTDEWRFQEGHALATGTPQVFLDAVWPWMRIVLDRMSVREGVPRIEYEDRYTLRENDRLEPDSLIHLAMAATAELAETDLESWVAFVRENEGSQTHTVHAVLAHGFGRVGQDGAAAAADYLLGDPRRLVLGDIENHHRHSQAAMQTVFEHGDAGDRLRLEEAIVGFKMYPREVLDAYPDAREDRLRYQSQHRLRLLRSIPPTRRSAQVRRLIQEGEERYPYTTDWDSRFTIATAVGPPVEANGMAEMSDEELLALFDAFDDTTGWDHPRARERDIGAGGVDEQSRAFRLLAAEAPGRVEALLPELDATRHQTYAAQALDGLVEAGIGAEALTPLVVALDARGFTGEAFRDRVASTFGTAAETGGLPDAALGLLKRWVAVHPAPATGESPGGDAPSHDAPSNPVSFGMGGFLGVVPHGRGYMTEAILKGHLHRVPRETDAALDWLESRLPPPFTPPAPPADIERYEVNAAVWAHAMMHTITTLNDDAERATALFDRVFATFPAVWRFPFPPRMVAIGMRAFAPDETVERWLDGLAGSPYPFDRHVYGELAMIAHTVRQGARFESRVHTVMGGADLVALRGLGLAAAEVWGAAHVRDVAAAVLEATVRRAPPPPERAAGSTHKEQHLWDGAERVVWQESTFDALTAAGRRVLAALGDRPEIAVRMAEHVVPHIDRLVGPDGTAETRRAAIGIAMGISEAVGAMGPRDPDRWGARRSLGDLTSVALTLHRSADPEVSAAGLDLFESLLRVDLFAAVSAQRAIDHGLGAGDLSGSRRRGSRPLREV